MTLANHRGQPSDCQYRRGDELRKSFGAAGDVSAAIICLADKTSVWMS